MEESKICEWCAKESADVVTYRQITNYVEDEQNIFTLCPNCREENDQHWAEMWREYNASVFKEQAE